jgi:hypothetical protein
MGIEYGSDPHPFCFGRGFQRDRLWLMWKAGCLFLLLSSLALAQSAGPSASQEAVNPLAGAKFWPKTQSGETRFAAAILPNIRLNFLEPRLLPPNKFRFDGIRNFNPISPATPQVGRCAIPLLQLKVPGQLNFPMRQMLPPDIDAPIVVPPAVPTCAAR